MTDSMLASKIITMCGCPSDLVNRWLLPDHTWIERPVVADSDSDTDATEFLALGGIAFLIMCPECGTVYAAGGVKQ